MNEIIVGVDEAGRGPLAGPVVAAAVILPGKLSVAGLKDSKLLSKKQRDSLAIIIKKEAIDFSVAEATVEEIDRLNIHYATLLAMTRAVQQLNHSFTSIFIDGKFVPDELSVDATAFIKGDQKYPCISAASILAKTIRDQTMITYHEQYPEYAFDLHKGYPTKKHLEALRSFGVTPIHRKTFKPVRDVINLSDRVA